MKTKILLSALLLLSAIANNALAQIAGEYKSNGSGGGRWHNAATWLLYNGETFAPATVPPSSTSKVTVQLGDSVTITNAATISRLTIDSGALVNIANEQTVTLRGNITANGGLAVHGILICNVYAVNGAGFFNLQAGATLNIGSASGITATGASGNIQTAVRTFHAAANYIYTSSSAQVTGNGLPAAITGSVMVNNSNTTSGLSLSQNVHVNKPGSFIVSASRILSSRTAAIIGSGNFILNSGATFYIAHASGLSAQAGVGCIQVTGTRILSPDANYTYNGSVAQVLGNGFPMPFTGLLTIANTSTAGCALNNNIVVNAPGLIKVVGAFACATYDVTGSGTFTLTDAATLLTANAAGLSTNGTSGSIKTTTINYSTSANYIYNGAVAQLTGSGLPASVASLAISNTSTGGVKLSNSVAINNTLALNTGVLCLDGHSLTIAPSKTIIRQNGSLSLCGGNVVYPGQVNLTYNSTISIATGAEIPSNPNLLNTLTLALSAGKSLTLSNTVTVNGVVTMTSGSLLLGGKTLIYATSASLQYNGTTAQTVSEEWPDNGFKTNIIIQNRTAATGVVLNATKTAYTGTLTVRSGGNFNSGNHTLSGTGNITVSAGGTFITSHAAGVSVAGAIQLTGTRTFATGSSYTFNGTTVQATGEEMPASIANLTINNQAIPSAVIATNTGSGWQTITGALTLANGILDLQANNMSLVFHTANMPIARTAGSLATGPASSLQFGAEGTASGAAIVLPDNLFTAAAPVLNDLVLNRSNGLTIGNQELTINGTLDLSVGVLNILNTTLTFQNSDVPVQVGSGSLTVGSGAALQFGTATQPGGKAFTLPHSLFTTSPVFSNFIVNRTNSLTLGEQNITLTGVLRLDNGALYIGANRLALNGSIDTSKGTLHGGTSSALVIGGSGNIILPAIGNGLNTLVINRAANGAVPAVSLGSDLHIESIIDLSNGSLYLGENNLVLSAKASILNADEHHCIVMSNKAGTGGYLIRPVASEPVFFPIGTASYTPATIRNTGGTVGAFKVRVIDGILEGGTSGIAYANSSHAVNKTWVIEKVGTGTATASLKLQWSAADENESFNRANSYLAHYDSIGWDTAAIVTPLEIQPGVYTMERTGITMFSSFIIQEDREVPKVKWISFTTVRRGTGLLLHWKVSNAKNNLWYDVERSVDGISYKKIGAVPAKNEMGNVEEYLFTDTDPLVYQASYYRLKQIGLGNQFYYSETLKVAGTQIQGTAVYPVPVQQQLNIALHAAFNGPVVVYCNDAAGRVIKKRIHCPETRKQHHHHFRTGSSQGCLFYTNSGRGAAIFKSQNRQIKS